MTHRALPWLLIALAALAPIARAQSETVVFSPYEQQDIAISKALLEAKTSIDMALYSISDESDWVDDPGPGADPADVELWKAFRARLETGDVKPFDMIKKKVLEEGVTARLVLHRAALDPWSIGFATSFHELGIEVRWTHKTMHHKFAIVDQKLIISGSGNWSRGAAERYSENTIIFRDHASLARQFAGEFRYLWDTLLPAGRASVFDPATAPVPEPDAAFFLERTVSHPWSRPVEAYFTSENAGTWEYTCADRIISEMRRAKREIKVMINHFNIARISNALIAIHRARNQNADPQDDVKIQVLMDLGEFDAGESGLSRSADLERAGIEVRYKAFSLSFFYPKAQFMHHKVLITDSERMVTGSYNWSRTAEHKNFENITVHSGPSQQALIDRVEGEFAQLWDLRRDLFPDFQKAVLSKPGDEGYRRHVPVHFMGKYFHTPMTLTRAEMESFRKPLEALGYRPANEDPEDPDTKNHQMMFFDKETGTFTSQAPAEAAFVADEDAIRTAPTPVVAETPPPANAPAPPTNGLVGELPSND